MTKVFVNNGCMAFEQRRPTEGELGILQVLWESGPRSVRDIQQILNQSRPTGYTTVLKLLQIMTEKGLVMRDEAVRPQIYHLRLGTCWQPQVKNLTLMTNSIYNGWRMEDVWLDK